MREVGEGIAGEMASECICEVEIEIESWGELNVDIPPSLCSTSAGGGLSLDATIVPA